MLEIIINKQSDKKIIMLVENGVLVEKHEAKCISKGGETKLVYGKIRCIN
jgi:hypothetical protein